jgi:hypothetical protein
MPLDHSKATATISLTGLAISCLNEATKNWEVGLVRAPRHEARITVAKVLPNGEVSQVMFQIDDRHSISITGDKVVVPQNQLYKAASFDRKNPASSDLEDIRWIIDLEHEFNGGKPLDVASKFPITPLIVSPPTLYADSRKLLRDMTLLNLNTEPPQEDKFGAVSEGCKADIQCSEGGAVTLKVDGPLGFSMQLPHIPGATHEIVIQNDCPPKPKADSGNGAPAQPGEHPAASNGHGPSDFNLYFSVVKFGDGVNLDLVKPAGIHGSDTVCNPSFLGSRASLFTGQ